MSLPGEGAKPEVAYLFKGGELILRSGEPATAAWEPGLLDSMGMAGIRIYKSHCAPQGQARQEGGSRVCAAARFAPESDLDIPGFSELRSLPFRAALAELPRQEANEAARGLALLNWLELAQHCGACGGRLHDDEKEGFESGARKCEDCGRLVFPRVSPAVIVLVRHGHRVLLAHNASFPPGRFGLIAGFVEPGETFEEAARRELWEEAGVEVEGLRYVSSQPWPFPDSLMVAFEADWAAGEARPDGVEITELRWCTKDDLPSIPPLGSVARALLDRFITDGRSDAGVS